MINTADPTCRLGWHLLAAIGRVESDHGRFGANQLDSSGLAIPGIFGPPLNGTAGTRTITDTDAGQLDGDTEYDRAVGPMQFEVVEDRMVNEFNSPIRFSRLDYKVARITDAAGAEALKGARGCEVLQRRDGTHVVLFADQWRANATARDNPDVLLEALPAGGV